MYEAKKEYTTGDSKSYHIPEWIRILKEYFRGDDDNHHLDRTTSEKNKKKGIEKLL